MFDFEEIKKQASTPELALWAAVVSEAVRTQMRTRWILSDAKAGRV